ncbi:Slp family lipoprotein [Methylacidimicrobium sp. B4]|uniref:Slp family lipoprotein n=1 Tax=Methylacidimicrobium sp. B4 TaxID=2796139 RepID=UPI001A8EA3BD|nr:Slp family lipoprotein [Methylacidimicrobium sp. B4]QSR84204.1 Slp family lipoprotein [Methylacidimicrobium sp. B4]
MNRLFDGKRRTIGCLALAVLLAGCSSPFSDEVRRRVRDQPSFSALVQKPSSYQGRIVMLGGAILRTTNLKAGTLLEVLQERLDGSDRPIASDRIGGRFLARSATFLDPSVYRKGRDVTVLGHALGIQAGQIGDRPYTYPLVAAMEIHLWPQYGGQRDSPSYPRRDWVWGYPGKGWSNTWGSVPPMTVPQ